MSLVSYTDQEDCIHAWVTLGLWELRELGLKNHIVGRTLGEHALCTG